MSNRVTLGGKLMFPSRFANAADLGGKAHTVEIARITRERVTNPDPKVRNDRTLTDDQRLVDRWAIWFGAARRAFILGNEFAQSIADALNEPNADKWIGQRVEIYPTKSRGKDCVRARRAAPNGAASLPEALTITEEEEEEEA